MKRLCEVGQSSNRNAMQFTKVNDEILSRPYGMSTFSTRYVVDRVQRQKQNSTNSSFVFTPYTGIASVPKMFLNTLRSMRRYRERSERSRGASNVFWIRGISVFIYISDNFRVFRTVASCGYFDTVAKPNEV